MEETPQEQGENLQVRADLLEAALTETPSSMTRPPLRSSVPSETESISTLMNTLVLRVDQVAKTSEEQFDRVEHVLQVTRDTTKLMQVLIAEQDNLQREVADQVDRLETVAEALIRVNANLTEIVAVLVQPNQRG